MSTRIRWMAAGSPLLLAAIVQFIAGVHASHTEHWYSRTLYPTARCGLGLLGARLSFVLGELVLTLVAITVLFLLFLRFRQWRAGRPVLRTTMQFALFAFGMVNLFFLGAWGLNYQRVPLAHNLHLLERVPSPRISAQLARYVILQANRARAEAQHEASSEPLADAVMRAWNTVDPAVAACYPLTPPGAPPKPFLGAPLMSHLGLSGVYMPYTGEPVYNGEIPSFDLPFAMAHEMAHQMGAARESEANFLAFLVCTHSDRASVRYSGYMGAMGLLTALKRTAPATFETTKQVLSPETASDLEERRQFWKRHEGWLRTLARTINDLYLRSQRISSGVRNYAEGDILITDYLQSHPELGWLPGGETPRTASSSPPALPAGRTGEQTDRTARLKASVRSETPGCDR